MEHGQISEAEVRVPREKDFAHMLSSMIEEAEVRAPQGKMCARDSLTTECVCKFQTNGLGIYNDTEAESGRTWRGGPLVCSATVCKPYAHYARLRGLNEPLHLNSTFGVFNSARPMFEPGVQDPNFKQTFHSLHTVHLQTTDLHLHIPNPLIAQGQ